MKDRNLFVVIGLSVFAIVWSHSTKAPASLRELDNTTRSPIVTESLGLSSASIDGSVNALGDNKAAIASTSEKAVEHSSASLSAVAEDLVLDGRQLSLESNVRIFQSVNENCFLTYRYPEISGLKNAALQAEINRNLQQEIDDLTQDFRTYFREDEGCTMPTDLHQAHLEVDPCRITFAKDVIVSMSCLSILLGVAAYPIPITQGINVNLSTGEFYELGDLFSEADDYPQRLKALLIEANNLEGFYDIENIIPDIEADTSFYLDSDCPAFSPRSVCLAVPTNSRSGPSRGLTLFLGVEALAGNLSSESIAEVLLN